MNATDAAWRFVVDQGDAVVCLVSVYCTGDCETEVAWVWETPHGPLVRSHYKTRRVLPYSETREQEQRWASMGFGKLMGVCRGVLTDPECPPIHAGCADHTAVELHRGKLHRLAVTAKANKRGFSRKGPPPSTALAVYFPHRAS